MSKKNGDRARFGKEHKKKLLRREQNLKLRQALVAKIIAPATIPTNQTPAKTT